jgi:hypothetical protein
VRGKTARVSRQETIPFCQPLRESVAKITSDPQTLPGRKNWLKPALPILLLLCLIPFYSVSYCAPAVGTFHDDGIYLVTAKALAEGKGYDIISLPDAPRQTKYPIGFPLLLAGVWKLFPDFPSNVPVLKIVPLLSALAWVAMGVLFARRWGRLSWTGTAWIVLFCAGTHWVVFAGTNFLSDLLFGALALASIHFLLEVEHSDAPLRAAVFAGALCAAAYFVRTSALSVMAGGVLSLAMQKRRVPALIFAGIGAAAIVAWAAWQHGGPAPSNPILAYYTAQNYTDWNLLTAAYTRTAKIGIALTNLFDEAVFPAQILVSSGTWVPWPAALALGIPAWIIFARGWRTQPHLRTAYVCFGVYLAMLLLWAWPPDRFLTSLLPIFLVGLATGISKRLAQPAWGLAAAAVLLGSAWPTLLYERSTGVPWMQSERRLDWKEVSHLHDWISRNTKPDDVIMANFDPAVYLYTGRKSVRPYVLDNLGLFYGFANDPVRRERPFRRQLLQSGVAYVIRSSTDQEELDLADWVARLRREGSAVAVEAVPDSYQIYRIQKSGVTSW